MIVCADDIQNPVAHSFFAHKLQALYPAIRKEEFYHVGIRRKAGSLHTYVIGHNHVQVLFPDFFRCIFQQMLGFRCKAHQKLMGLATTQKLQDIRIFVQCQRQILVMFLIFWGACWWGL